MAAPIRVAFEGDAAMKKKLEAIASDKGMRKEARVALLAFGGEKLIVAQSRVRVKTGKLRDTGKVKAMVSSKKEDLRVSIVFGGDGVKYANVIESRFPFILPTILEAARTATQDISEKIDMGRAARA